MVAIPQQSDKREVMRKTIQSLKENVVFQSRLFHSEIILANDYIRRWSKESKGDRDALDRLDRFWLCIQISRLRESGLLTYIQTIESYLIEIDETFDDLIKEATERAEKKAALFPSDLLSS